MFKVIFVLVMFLGASSALAEDFILRPAAECCGSDSAFKAGSEAILFNGDKSISESSLTTDAHFTFSNVKAGKYDLAVSAVGYYPEKFRDVEVGKDDVFDFELVAALRPTRQTAILEGHIIVWFKKSVSDDEIRKRLADWDLGALHAGAPGASSRQSQHRIDRKYDFAEVRVRYERSRDLSDLIWTALKDPAVVSCTPVYFSQ